MGGSELATLVPSSSTSVKPAGASPNPTSYADNHFRLSPLLRTSTSVPEIVIVQPFSLGKSRQSATFLPRLLLLSKARRLLLNMVLQFS